MASSTYYHGADPTEFPSGGNDGAANRTIGNTDNFTLGFLQNGVSGLDIGSAGTVLCTVGLVGNDRNAGVGTTLAEALDNSETEIDLTSVTGFTNSGTVQVDLEQITYTGISTNTLTGCTRGANSTSNVIHSNGVAIGQVVDLSGSYNYLSGGPLSITSGAVIEVGSGATWTVA